MDISNRLNFLYMPYEDKMKLVLGIRQNRITRKRVYSEPKEKGSKQTKLSPEMAQQLLDMLEGK